MYKFIEDLFVLKLSWLERFEVCIGRPAFGYIFTIERWSNMLCKLYINFQCDRLKNKKIKHVCH